MSSRSEFNMSSLVKEHRLAAKDVQSFGNIREVRGRGWFAVGQTILHAAHLILIVRQRMIWQRPNGAYGWKRGQELSGGLDFLWKVVVAGNDGHPYLNGDRPLAQTAQVVEDKRIVLSRISAMSLGIHSLYII